MFEWRGVLECMRDGSSVGCVMPHLQSGVLHPPRRPRDQLSRLGSRTSADGMIAGGAPVCLLLSQSGSCNNDGLIPCIHLFQYHVSTPALTHSSYSFHLFQRSTINACTRSFIVFATSVSTSNSLIHCIRVICFNLQLSHHSLYSHDLFQHLTFKGQRPSTAARGGGRARQSTRGRRNPWCSGAS
jgi:hypothetical protein